MSRFAASATSTRVMQLQFEEELEKILPVHFIVSDGFLWWTLESANRFSVPMYSFYGMGNFATALSKAVAVEYGFLSWPLNKEDNEAISIPSFPLVKLRRSDLDLPHPEIDSILFDFHMKSVESTVNSHGQLMNSFEELEPEFLHYLNRDPKPKMLCIGLLCLAAPPECEPGSELINGEPSWVQWQDLKLDQGSPVLYVAFGSQIDISAQQLKEIATRLEKAGTHFLWVLKAKNADLEDGFEERIEGRGLVIKDWVDQRRILIHPSVKGFLSHCGWNSVMESICNGVPILAWPKMFDQPLNANLVVEELRVRLRVGGPSMKLHYLFSSDALKRSVGELMEGEEGKVVKKKVEELAQMARTAMAEGGSSWHTLNSIMDDI